MREHPTIVIVEDIDWIRSGMIVVIVVLDYLALMKVRNSG